MVTLSQSGRRHACRVVSVRAFLAWGLLGLLLAPVPATAQDATPAVTASASPAQGGGAPVRVRLPDVTVTAEKESEDPHDIPVSVTAVTRETLENAGVRSVSEAAAYAPNTFFNEFTARKLSNPRFRGIGSSPNNPAVTTYIDGVPQLNANTSSIELLDVDQIEFVRGPQSALYGRNALGGVINIISPRPSLRSWTGGVIGPYGNFNDGEVRATASGPLSAGKLAVGVGIGYSGRDGFTVNDVTGHGLDSRSALFGKGQVLWRPAERWEVRAIFSGERARDGDYALNDLAALRANPFHASRNVEGFTHRDIVAPTLTVGRAGPKIDFSATTGFVWWKTEDLTDLDYTALPLITRNNAEHALQFTEEFRLASAKNAPIVISDRVTMRWQAGVFVFTQAYDQNAVNNFSPFVLDQRINFPVSQTSPQSTLDDRGLGLYGRATWTFSNKIDVSVGVRGDREHKQANVNTFYSPVIAPPVAVDAQRDFGDVSPQVAVAYRVAPRQTVYVTVARGFKAGGFNPASPAGSEGYGEEHSWNYEGGVKGSWLADRVSVSAAVFHIDWRELQVNLPNPAVPAQFYVSNAGGATSNGVELELQARPLAGLDFFGGLGNADAHFASGSLSGGVSVGGNKLANSPSYTADLGVQYSRAIVAGATLYGRAEVVRYGDFQYDDANTAGQSAYSLAHFRAGVRTRRVFAEGWIRNAFDTRYIPVAFAYPAGLAPSGFIGESGAPRTFGLRAGVMF
jgi:iron complex outermembrane receptor protein